ncbi:hypothetical protein DFH07DRAFT_838220 [Mycena maculata]|uniref:Uncharacterized protein n=1 Tax=Mycena maculata TaxID=230809 RepID=A0AAD7IFK1_9AGAR|nr:hypothetical protein DFH07DRAFT_838220 [Mycena maculata]
MPPASGPPPVETTNVTVRWRQAVNPTNQRWRKPTAKTSAPAQQTVSGWQSYEYHNQIPPAHRTSVTQPVARYVPPPPPLPRPPPPKEVIVPLVTADAEQEPPPLIPYQTLELLLKDLNRLLCTPHDDQPFHFLGTCAIIVKPAASSAEKVASVAWDVLVGTAVTYNIHRLTVHGSEHNARMVTPSSAIWMGAPPDARLAEVTVPRACNRCNHLFSIRVTRCHGPLIGGKDISGLQGQRITIELKHFEK